MTTAKFYKIDSWNRPVFKAGRKFYCIIDELISDQHYCRWEMKLDAIGTEQVCGMIERASNGALAIYVKSPNDSEGEPSHKVKDIRLAYK